MSELTLLVLQLAFLLLLWVFVFAIVYALRSDLFGQRVRKLQPEAAAAAPAPVHAGAPRVSGGDVPTAAVARPAPGAPSGGGGDATAENASRLVITSGSKAGAEFPLGRDEITIGRSSDSAIIIRDDYTSTHHARLMLWNGRWMIQDLDSTNGTFLNGSRVTVPTPIPLGATVKVGATTFELRR
ncbi:FHA domain-containing protein [Agromyces sp. NPDC056523]|uniref:FHA domain-containing protein FhaB/FipA n=1 Tax=Agromyces sp. NPDC056523 TaxID=3345850 RepID=UPI00366DD49B